MRTVDIHEARTDLPQLVEQAAAGEPFIIAKAGGQAVGESCGAGCPGACPRQAAWLHCRPDRRAGQFRPMGKAEVLDMCGIKNE
jgi:hypothetical protein